MRIEVGLLSLLHFIMVMDLVSENISEKEERSNMPYSADLAVMADTNEKIQQILHECSKIIKTHDFRMNIKPIEGQGNKR